MSESILFIDDNEELRMLIKALLQDAGYQVLLADSGKDGLAKWRQNQPEAVLLDLGLPDVDGLEICRQIRHESDRVPIIILTARDGEIDRVLGLELGADDYITKPFSRRELLARVRGVLRRSALLGFGGKNPDGGILNAASLAIYVDKRRVQMGHRWVALTVKEFDLLVCLAKDPGKVFSRGELLRRVWGYREGCFEHTVNSHINRLRAKIEEDPAHPAIIQTVWGIGYKFRDPDDDAGLMQTAKGHGDFRLATLTDPSRQQNNQNHQ